MDEALLVRLIYGFSLSFHNLFADIPIGLAIIHFFYSVAQFKAPTPKNTYQTNFIFHFLVLSIILSVTSGFAFELEFPRYWSDFYSSLKNLNHHIGHKSAVISFFFSSFLIIATYYFRLSKRPLINLVLSIIWIVLAWLFSGWGIFVNTIMQHPGNAIMQNGVLVLQSDLADMFWSQYHLIRQIHIAAASVLKVSVLLLLIWALFNKELFQNQLKLVSSILLASLLTLVITGHFQAVNISHYQPSKFAAMEGLIKPEDKSNWHFLGFMSSNEDKTAISLGDILPALTDANLISISEIPLENCPPVATVFNSFRVMIYSSFVLIVMAVFIRFKSVKLSASLLIAIFLIAELAINSGWILSETGRQPWTFFGLQRRVFNQNTPYILTSLFVMIANAIILVFATYFALDFMKRNLANYSSKEEK